MYKRLRVKSLANPDTKLLLSGLSGNSPCILVPRLNMRPAQRPQLNARQCTKLIVYSLLLVNFLQYVLADIEYMRHHFHSGWRWHDWTASFTTTIDELSWFVILILLELETFLLSDSAFSRSRMRAIHLVKAICYLSIGHTIFVYARDTALLANATHFVDTTLCTFSDQALSFSRNLTYWELNATNCAQLSSENEFFIFFQGQAITDASGMQIELQLAWADLIEATVWILVLLVIELSVKLQDRGVGTSVILSFATYLKYLLYGVLWSIAAYWAYRGHWIFAWDETLWILGFMAISANLSQWRKQLAGVSKNPALD